LRAQRGNPSPTRVPPKISIKQAASPYTTGASSYQKQSKWVGVNAVLVQAVKRNLARFSQDFMFQLPSSEEFAALMIATPRIKRPLQ
jgi:hypothetical protein